MKTDLIILPTKTDEQRKADGPVSTRGVKCVSQECLCLYKNDKGKHHSRSSSNDCLFNSKHPHHVLMESDEVYAGLKGLIERLTATEKVHEKKKREKVEKTNEYRNYALVAFEKSLTLNLEKEEHKKERGAGTSKKVKEEEDEVYFSYKTGCSTKYVNEKFLDYFNKQHTR